jgi:tetratricopeptide (TPR) repeat protein
MYNNLRWQFVCPNISIKGCCLFLLMLFYLPNVSKTMAQGISKEELNKKIAEAKRKMGHGNLSNNAFMKKMMQSAPKNQPMVHASTVSDLPPLNILAMSKLPKRTLSAPQLKEHIAIVINKLKTAMKPDQLQAVQELVEKCEGDSIKMGYVGVLSFYKGMEKEGVLLVARAAAMNVADSTNLGNLGGLLTVCNQSVYSIPILKYALKTQPKNTILLNNIGQAFMKLGAKDSALVYLNKCLKDNPRFAKANTTAALIAKSQGNTTKATQLVKEAMESEYSETAEILAEKLGVKIRPDFTATTVGIPDYFNLYGFKLPKIQRNTSEYEEVITHQQNYLAGLKGLEDELSERYNAARDKGANHTEISKIKELTGIHPITARAMKKLMAEYTSQDNMVYLAKVKSDYQTILTDEKKKLDADLEILSETYKRQFKELADRMGDGEGDQSEAIKNLKKAFCYQENKRKDQYLYKSASATEAHHKKILHFAREQFHFQSKWHYLAALNEHAANAAYYQAALTYVGHLKSLYKLATADDGCSKYNIEVNKIKIDNPFDRICPIDFSLSAGFVEFKINCKSGALAVNYLGLKVKYSEDFIKKESTFEIGLATPNMGEKSTGFELPVSASAEVSHMIYITFGSKEQVVDWGYRMTTEASVSLGVGAAKVGAEFSMVTKIGVISGTEIGPSTPDGLFTLN